jgi:hypothetical protein
MDWAMCHPSGHSFHFVMAGELAGELAGEMAGEMAGEIVKRPDPRRIC